MNMGGAYTSIYLASSDMDFDGNPEVLVTKSSRNEIPENNFIPGKNDNMTELKITGLGLNAWTKTGFNLWIRNISLKNVDTSLIGLNNLLDIFISINSQLSS